MKRHFSLLAAAVATLFAVGGNLFAKDAPESQTFETPILAKDADFAERQLAFALTTFHRALESESAHANTLVAPFGVYRVLGALSLGSAGQTKTEIDAALFRSDLKDDAWKKDVAAASETLRNAPEIKTAGGLWAASGFKLRQDFVADLRDLADQNASTFDFARDDARQEINAWFSRNTNGRVTNLLNSLHPETSLLLADATTFDGQWKYKFDPKNTRDGAFAAINGAEVKFPLMSQTASFLYYDADDFQYLEAPYAGDRFSLVVVLPNGDKPYAEVERELTPAKLLDCRKNAKETLLDFHFPKFTVERSVNLVSTLQKSGVVAAFSLDANLSPIAGDVNLQIDQAKQGAFLSVDEDGTEAAAATVATAVPKAASPKFHANRPFFYLIRDNASGAVLFAGRFVSPQKDGGLDDAPLAEADEEEKESDDAEAEEDEEETDQDDEEDKSDVGAGTIASAKEFPSAGTVR